MTTQVILEVLKQKLSSLQNISPSQVWTTLTTQTLKLQSWSKFVRPGNYSRPPQTASEWFSRIIGNMREHSSNYGVIYGAFFIYALITSPFLLFSMGFVAALYVYAFHINPEFSVGGVTPTTAQKYIGFALITLVLFFLTSASSTLFWVFGISTVVVVSHATFFTPADESNPFGAPPLPASAPLTGGEFEMGPLKGAATDVAALPTVVVATENL